MKAFLVMCVLIGSRVTESQNSLCTMTTGVCGCCLITKQLERTSLFFSMSYHLMFQELNATAQTLSDIRASQSVFSAVLTNTQQNCTTQVPSSADSRVIYNNIKVNWGGNYNSTQGVFVAPLRGVYTFAVTLYNNSPQKSCAAFKVNGVIKYTLMEKLTSDIQDSSSLSLTLHLEAGDKVFVDQPAGCVMCARDNLYNTFTGYLLYATA